MNGSAKNDVPPGFSCTRSSGTIMYIAHGQHNRPPIWQAETFAGRDFPSLDRSPYLPRFRIQYQGLMDFPWGLWCYDARRSRLERKNGSRVDDAESLGVVFLAFCAVAGAGSVAAQPATGSGRLEGVVVRQDGSGVGGVLVLIEELRRSELTDTTGKYAFGGLPPATYTVLSTLGPQSLRQSGVVISAGATTTLRAVVDWPLSVFESVVVNGTTRLPARLVEAPAAVTVVGSDELETHALHGQLPRLLASTPGVEFVQSGLYDFNVNSRGFNTFYNRHVLTRIDGRDPSLPTLLGHVDWATLSHPLDDIDQLEFVRGPGAALYGGGAFNGIMNLRTKAPRDSLGGRARYTAGELGTQRIEFREAAAPRARLVPERRRRVPPQRRLHAIARGDGGVRASNAAARSSRTYAGQGSSVVWERSDR